MPQYPVKPFSQFPDPHLPVIYLIAMVGQHNVARIGFCILRVVLKFGEGYPFVKVVTSPFVFSHFYTIEPVLGMLAFHQDTNFISLSRGIEFLPFWRIDEVNSPGR